MPWCKIVKKIIDYWHVPSSNNHFLVKKTFVAKQPLSSRTFACCQVMLVTKQPLSFYQHNSLFPSNYHCSSFTIACFQATIIAILVSQPPLLVSIQQSLLKLATLLPSNHSCFTTTIACSQATIIAKTCNLVAKQPLLFHGHCCLSPSNYNNQGSKAFFKEPHFTDY